MRPMTIDLDSLEAILESRDPAEYYLDQETGEIHARQPGDPVPGEQEKYDVQPDRYLHVERLDLSQSLAMREAFLFSLHDPDTHLAHPVLADALAGRKPLRTFDFKLEDFPGIRDRWARYRSTQLREYALTWLHEQGLEPIPAR